MSPEPNPPFDPAASLKETLALPAADAQATALENAEAAIYTDAETGAAVENTNTGPAVENADTIAVVQDPAPPIAATRTDDSPLPPPVTPSDKKPAWRLLVAPTWFLLGVLVGLGAFFAIVQYTAKPAPPPRPRSTKRR